MAAAPPPVLLLLAAGASSRMRGRDKLLEEVGGAPLLACLARRGLEAGLAVIVTLPPDRPARAAALAGLPVQGVTVPDAAEGLSASLRAGVAAAPSDAALMVLLADLPEITAEDLARMAAAHAAAPGRILRATTADGRPGHPLVFPAALRPALLTLRGDRGARDLLQRHPVLAVPLPGDHAVTDLDTPEDWAGWRARQKRP